jgi:pimeloyl-ACP methyl ester carboxylesterase
MMLNKSQPLSALSVFRPDISRLRNRWLRAISSAWVSLLLSCGVPGPESSGEDISEIRRQIYSGDTPAVKKISALVAGEPKGRQVIFVHGTPGSAEGWADFMLTVPSGFQYLAIDRPGHGGSGPEHAVTSLAEQAKAIGLLLDTRTCRKPILVGHSLGGPIVAWLAATQPGRVAGLVIVAGSLDPSQEQIHPLQRLGASWFIRNLLPRSIRNANSELMALKAELVKLQALLKEISVPVIIVHGLEDDLVPYENVFFMQSNLTGAKLVIEKRLEGANHFLPWNARDQVTAAIMELAENERAMKL